jgi:hypothetical protein
MVVKSAIAGKYFDVDSELSGAEAAAFVAAGFAGCIRYFPLNSLDVPGCLTSLELQILLSAGLSVAAVQHVDSFPWTPTAALGTSHGNYAAAYAKAIGYPSGAAIYCDMESPATTATAEDCIAYLNAWVSEVQAAGYVPSLYIGWGVPMTPKQIYDLPVIESYWAAYNYTDGVATRGVQIQQHTAKVLNGINYDPNTVAPDLLGDLPIFVFSS